MLGSGQSDGLNTERNEDDMSNNENTPRVWIGCLHCYNNGRLVGDWWDALEAADVTPEDVHGKPVSESHDELWCFDIENIPTGEIDPMTAAEWGERFEEVGEHDWGAFLAYVDLGGHGGDIPTAEQFHDAYCGEFGTMRAYAMDLLDDLGYLNNLPDLVAGNIDWDGVARDLEQDHTEQDGHIFRTV